MPGRPERKKPGKQPAKSARQTRKASRPSTTKTTSGGSSGTHAVLSAPISRLIQSAHAIATDGDLYLPAAGSPPSQTFTTIQRRCVVLPGTENIAAALFYPLRTAMNDWNSFNTNVGQASVGAGYYNPWDGNGPSIIPSIYATTAASAWESSDQYEADLGTGNIGYSASIGSPMSSSDWAQGDRVRLVKVTARAKFVGSSLTNAGLPMWVPVHNFNDLWAQESVGGSSVKYDDLMNARDVVEFDVKDYGWHNYTWLPADEEDIEYLAGVNCSLDWYGEVIDRTIPPATLAETYTGDGKPLVVPTMFVGKTVDDQEWTLPLGEAFSFMPFMFIAVDCSEGSSWVVEMEACFERIGQNASNTRARIADADGLDALMSHVGGIASRMYTPPGGEQACIQRTMGHVGAALTTGSTTVHGAASTAASVAKAVGGTVVTAGHIANAVSEVAEIAGAVGSLFL